jgi:hypothetical protein
VLTNRNQINTIKLNSTNRLIRALIHFLDASIIEKHDHIYNANTGTLKELIYIQSKNIIDTDAVENKVTVTSADIFSAGDEVIIGDESISTLVTIDSIVEDDIFFVEDLSEAELVGAVIKKSNNQSSLCLYNNYAVIYVALDVLAGESYILDIPNQNLILESESMGTVMERNYIIKKIRYTPPQAIYPNTEEMAITAYIDNNVSTKKINFVKENFEIENIRQAKYLDAHASLEKLMKYRTKFNELYSVIETQNTEWNTMTLTEYTTTAAYQFTFSDMTLDSSARTFLDTYSTIIPIVNINGEEFRAEYITYETIGDVVNYAYEHQREFIVFYDGTDCLLYVPKKNAFYLKHIHFYGR